VRPSASWRRCAHGIQQQVIRWRNGRRGQLQLQDEAPPGGAKGGWEDTRLDIWIWGLSLIALTVAIHVTGVTFMVFVQHNIRVRLESRNLRLARVLTIGILAIVAMALLLGVLHLIEAALWAAAYLWVGALGSPEAAILYSVDSMATRGASGSMLQSHWQMLGALEAADGMLLFGISTAFVFTVMQFYYQHLVFRTPPDS
jgi:hypothetical protein